MVDFSMIVNLFIFSSIVVILLKYIFKDNKVILQLDTRFLLICMVVIVCRMLVPIESPITNNIAVSKVYPKVYKILKEPIVAGLLGGISIIGILQFIWFVGAVVRLVQISYSYIRLSRAIRKYPEIRNPNMLEIMERVNQKHKHPVKFHLVSSEEGSTPYVFGVFKPYIVLTDIIVTEKDLEYIFSHEMGHYYRGDLLIIILREVFNAIYWWNPFAYMLNGLISQAQEINVDFNVLRKLKKKETFDYSACLLKLSRDGGKDEERWLMSFKKEDTDLLDKRINLMIDNLDISKRKTVVSVLLSLIMVGLIAVCPNVISFEPYGIPEADVDGSSGLKDKGVFYLENNDGTYRLYIDGEYMTTVYTVFDESIPVYSDIEEVK